MAPSSMSSNQESSSGGLLKWIVDDESNKHNESITPIEREHSAGNAGVPGVQSPEEGGADGRRLSFEQCGGGDMS